MILHTLLAAAPASNAHDTPGLSDTDVATLWSTELLYYVLVASMVVIGVNMLCCAYRLMKGPHMADRALAVDSLGVQLMGLVILLAMVMGTNLFFEAVLVLALLSFAGMVAMAQFIGRPHERGQHAKRKLEG